MPDDDAAGALYELTQEVLETAGLPAYEVSNHARPGQESRHNLTYWRYGDYVGVGPGAHGRLTLPDGKVATVTHRAPEVWLQQVEQRGTAAKPFEPIAAEQRLEELLMMGLRLTEGVALARIHEETGRPWRDWLDCARLDRLTKGGFLVRTDGRLRATAAGRQRLSAVLASLLG
jgi:oxygen-independent coproporphyrinogen-3 oxidase